MLVGLLLYLLSGPADYGALMIPAREIQVAVEEHVNDEKALNELTALLEAEEEAQLALSEEVSSICLKMLETNKNYDARAADFVSLDSRLTAATASAQERGLTLRAEMKERMTREEWEAVWAK